MWVGVPGVSPACSTPGYVSLTPFGVSEFGKPPALQMDWKIVGWRTGGFARLLNPRLLIFGPARGLRVWRASGLANGLEKWSRDGRAQGRRRKGGRLPRGFGEPARWRAERQSDSAHRDLRHSNPAGHSRLGPDGVPRRRSHLTSGGIWDRRFPHVNKWSARR